tara:strand:+ start:6249 stop:6989 length:741 start_codon:yes stop_codon:yes gene_type:complete
MYRYQILIEYVGSGYKGWQIQKKGKTVQGILQEIVSKFLKEKITIVGAGRTDAGVHAISQSAHFDSKNLILDKNKFLKSVNHFLKSNMISVLNIKKKNKQFHARYSAKSRIYEYLIYNRISPPVLDKDKCWHIMKKLDLKEMKMGAQKLLGTKDFSTFRASSCNAKSPMRTIKSATIKKQSDKIIIKFISQSFLQQQVRSMVGCLKYLGERKWSLKKFYKVIKSKNRSNCAPPAPARGLFLKKIIY